LDLIPLQHVSPTRLTFDELRWGKGTGFSEIFPGEAVQRTTRAEITSSVSGPKVDALRDFFANPAYMSMRIAFARLSDIVIDSSLGVCITRDGKIIKESAHVAQIIDPGMKSIANHESEEHVRLITPVLHCFHRSSPAYGHFIFDSLAAIVLFKDVIVSGRLKILLPPYFPGWALSIFSEIGFDPALHIATFESKFVLCQKVIIPEFIDTQNTFYPNVRICERLREISVQRGEASPTSRPHVYLSRRNQVTYSDRSIVNEEDVQRVLQQLGYSIIEPGNMSFSSQVETMRNASVIVGPHGSSFGNLVFASKGVSVIDLMPASWVHFWDQPDARAERWVLNVTTALNLAYTLLLCKSELIETPTASATHPKRSIRYFVDIETLKRAAARRQGLISC
jgi:capsular polysaccharide biosynthesis protein